MAVFKYSADSTKVEGTHETGTIVAGDKLEAFDRLRSSGLTNIRLKKVEGLAAFLEQLRVGK